MPHTLNRCDKTVQFLLSNGLICCLLQASNLCHCFSQCWVSLECSISFLHGKILAALMSESWLLPSVSYVYKQSSGDKGVTTTLLCCICASGMSILPVVIFKGVRMNELLPETPCAHWYICHHRVGSTLIYLQNGFSTSSSAFRLTDL